MNLSSVKWWVHKYPFRHYRAQNVLDPETYGRVSGIFQSLLERSETGAPGSYVLRKLNPKYDAHMLGMDDTLAEDFQPFFSLDWLGTLARLTGIPEVPRMDGGLHSNPRGSHSGWIHTDLCSAWFDESAPEPGLLPRRKMVDYFSGKPKHKDAKPVEYVRAVTMIYYLCNDGWTPGDGGETGLYPSANPGPDAPVELVPPINNSLFVFECSPHSYHRFVANPGRTRNSIILWLHSTVETAESMWRSGINRRAAA